MLQVRSDPSCTVVRLAPEPPVHRARNRRRVLAGWCALLLPVPLMPWFMWAPWLSLLLGLGGIMAWSWSSNRTHPEHVRAFDIYAHGIVVHTPTGPRPYSWDAMVELEVARRALVVVRRHGVDQFKLADSVSDEQASELKSTANQAMFRHRTAQVDTDALKALVRMRGRGLEHLRMAHQISCPIRGQAWGSSNPSQSLSTPSPAVSSAPGYTSASPSSQSSGLS